MSNITTDFITATKKIVAEVRGVLTALHLIRDDVRVIRDQVVTEGNKQAANQQTNESDAQQPNRIAGRGEIGNVNQADGRKENGGKKTSSYFSDLKQNLFKAVREPKFFIEIGALAGLALYTCETRRTNQLTQCAIKQAAQTAGQAHTDATEQRILSVRPWIGVKDSPDGFQTGPIRFDANSSAAVGYKITAKNYSTSGAQRINAMAFLVLNGDLNVIEHKWKEACGDNYVGVGDGLLNPSTQEFYVWSSSTPPIPRAEMDLDRDGKAIAFKCRLPGTDHHEKSGDALSQELRVRM